MALHINLYHEVQSQARARQRDPLKLGIAAMLVIAIGFAAYYFYRMGHVSSVRSQLGAVQSEWQKLEPKAKAAKTTEEELTSTIKLSENLVKHIDSRVYWAPIFDEVMEVVPREVQITRINGDLSGDPAKPSIISVSGISSSSEPRKAAEDLRMALDSKLSSTFKQVNSSFRSLEDSEEAATADGGKRATANFSMEFQVTVAEAAPTPAPVARKPKS